MYDTSVLSRIYDEYGARLYHYLLAMLRSKDDAEDVLQILFMRLAHRQKRLGNVKNLTGYLFASARNEAIRFIRKSNRRREVMEDFKNIALLESGNDEKISPDEVDRINRALTMLPQHQREVIVLKVYEGLNFREIARVTKTFPNTVASRYRYGVEKLRNLFQGEE